MSSGEAQNVKYVPKRKIRAIGSFYSVYEATQVGLNRPVELRVLNFKLQPGSAEVARFKHEFSTLANLDHPNIIRVLDMGVMADHVFYVTDLRNSKSFQELFEKGRSFAVEEALSITRSLGQALSHLHKKNILHRDLTPSAVYLDQETSIAYINEFSVVKNLNMRGLTARGIPTLKTLGRTPEAMLGLPYDPRTDLYMLGLLLYQMLTGEEPPYNRPGTPEAAEPVRVRKLNPKVSSEVEAIVGKLLKEKMDDRFQTAEDLLSDLDKATEKLDVKSVISEIAESTVTELKVPRPPPKLTDTLVKASRSRALEQAAGRPADETTQIRTEVVKKPSGAAAGTVDPMLWIRAHKEYLFMGGAPALLVLVLMVLFATRSDEPPPVPTSTPTPTTSSSQGGGKSPDWPRINYLEKVKATGKAIKSAPTNKETFHQRWYLLDNWVKQMASEQKQAPFSQSDLVSVRINFYRDEAEAAQKLDGLYDKAMAFVGR